LETNKHWRTSIITDITTTTDIITTTHTTIITSIVITTTTDIITAITDTKDTSDWTTRSQFNLFFIYYKSRSGITLSR
jgi:hypothetical protein